MPSRKKPKSSQLRREIGGRIRAVREAIQPVQARFASFMAMDARVLAKYEDGTRYPDEAFAVAFCNVTGATADFLYRGIFSNDMDRTLAVRVASQNPEMAELSEQAVMEAKRALAERRNHAI